jgi:hypothetical protein
MVPHSLFVRSDRRVDLALNMLTLLVSGALLATLAYLVFMWLRPSPVVSDRGDVGPPAWAAMSDVLATPARLEFDLPLPMPRVEFELPLPYGLAIYRCEHRGEVTYSDRPCLSGRVRPLSIRRF